MGNQTAISRLTGRVKRFLRYQAEPNVKPVSRIVELLLFTFLVPLAGKLLFASDPVGIGQGMPWIVLGPLLFTVRYGLVWGGLSAMLAASVLFVPGFLPIDQLASRVPVALGLVVLVLLTGEVVRSRERRYAQVDAENHYLRQRLKEFATDYHVLKVSHGQLEEHMAGQRLSLREALQKLKPGANEDVMGNRVGNDLLAILSQFCSLQVAGLYAVDEQGRCSSEALAVLGDMGQLPASDPMLSVAIEERQLVSVKHLSLETMTQTPNLVAVLPICGSAGDVHAVVAIRDMHFMGYQQQNLNLLALLGEYAGNLYSRSRDVGSDKAAAFLNELDTVLRFATSHHIESSLVAVLLKGGPETEAAAGFVADTVRSLDASWRVPYADGDDVRMVAVLLPLVQKAQSSGFVKRASQALEAHFDQLPGVMLDAQVLEVDCNVSRDDCLAFLEQSAGASRIAALQRRPQVSTPAAVESASDVQPMDEGFRGAA